MMQSSVFSFTDDDPFWCIDIDGCIDNGQISNTALDILARFPAAYREISMSGRGIHIIGSGSLPIDHRRKKDGLEIYSCKRMVVITGKGASGDTGAEYTEAINALLHERGMINCSIGQMLADHDGYGPAPNYTGPASNHELLTLAMKSTSVGCAFGNTLFLLPICGTKNQRPCENTFPVKTDRSTKVRWIWR